LVLLSPSRLTRQTVKKNDLPSGESPVYGAGECAFSSSKSSNFWRPLSPENRDSRPPAARFGLPLRAGLGEYFMPEPEWVAPAPDGLPM
jgi:hypothetical protein